MLAQALWYTYLLMFYLHVVVSEAATKYSVQTQSSTRLSHAKRNRWWCLPTTTGMKTRTSFTCKTSLQLLKGRVPFLCSLRAEEFKVVYPWVFVPWTLHRWPSRTGDASQGRPAFEGLIWLCIILSPTSTFRRVTAALSAVSVHSRDLANGVWWNGTAHRIGDWL